MVTGIQQLGELLTSLEDENLEFKAARPKYSFDKLAMYCAALANEGGGKMILGVTDKRPRQVVGTLAFPEPERTRRSLIDKLRVQIGLQEILHPDGRVLVFRVPSRPIGTVVQYEGKYWSRDGDSLVPLATDRLRGIFAEAGDDFSAGVCEGASLADLDEGAIEDFRERWVAKSGNQALRLLSKEQLLTDAEAITDGLPTYAALILFGTRKILTRHLAQAEVIFEYRSSRGSGPAQHREEFREGFFGYYDRLWELTNLRNDVQHYQSGLFVLDIHTFAERTVREAILNAVSHRDYQLSGSIFLRQNSRSLTAESPGGFPIGITVDNILDRQSPRNRRIAELFAKCGLVERSGQGMNLMFEESIQQGKAAPDFTGTDQYQVTVNLHGQVQDPQFVRFLEKVGQERLELFATSDFLALHLLHNDKPIPEKLQASVDRLAELGVIEKVGQGRGSRMILSRELYSFLGKAGVYTRKRGLDRETNKQLLLKHLKDSAGIGSPLRELMQVLPTLSRHKVRRLLLELAGESRAHCQGRGRGTRWFAGPARELGAQ